MDPRDKGYQQIDKNVYKDGNLDFSATGALRNHETNQFLRKRREEEFEREKKVTSSKTKLYLVEILKKLLLSPSILFLSFRVTEETHGDQRTLQLLISMSELLDHNFLSTGTLSNLKPKELSKEEIDKIK